MTRTEHLLAEILGTLQGLEIMIPFAKGEELDTLCTIYTSAYMLKLRTMP
jgi:hypothetical protein